MIYLKYLKGDQYPDGRNKSAGFFKLKKITQNI